MNFTTPNAVDDGDQCSPDSAYHSPFNGSKTTLVYGSAQQNGSEKHQRRRQSSRLEQSSKGHEKSTSWPPADLQTTTATSSSGVSSRTSSWSGNATSSQLGATEFTLAPRLGGTRADERPSPATPGQYTSRGYDDASSGILRRHRPGGDAVFHAAVSTRLSNYSPDDDDGDRALQSRRRPHSDFFAVDKMTRHSSYARAMGASQDSSGPEDSPLSPPPLPATSPPRGAMPSMSDSDTPSVRPGNYPYPMRIRPFYNTSSQTDHALVEAPQIGNVGDETADGRPLRTAMRTSQSYSTAVQFQQATGVQRNLSSSTGELRSSLTLQLMGRQPPVTDVDSGTPKFVAGESDGVTGLGCDKSTQEDQTNIFRRLSKELYGQQTRYGQTMRMSVDSGGSVVQLGPRMTGGNRKLDSRLVAMTDNGVSPMTTTTPPDGDSSQVDEHNDVDVDAESNFVRTRKSQVSLRKAFGIFEEVDAEKMLALSETAEYPDLLLLQPNSALPASRRASASGDENQRRSKERPTNDSGGYQPRRQRGASGAPIGGGDVDLPKKVRAMPMTDGGLHLVERTASNVQNQSSYTYDVHSSLSSSGSGSGSSVGLVSVYGRTSNTDSAGILPPSPRDVVSPVKDCGESVHQRVGRKSVSLLRGVTPTDSGYFGFAANSSHNSSFSAFEDHRRRSLEKKQVRNDMVRALVKGS